MNRIRSIIVALLVSILIATATVAQDKPRSSPPGSFGLEIAFYGDEPPAYQSVPGRAWYSRFRHITSRQPAGNSLPVKAVNIVSRKENDGVRVEVSVFLGIRFHEKEERVGSYFLRVDEKARIDELMRLGVEPFEITLIKVPPVPPVLPSIVNKTQSLEVISIELNDTAFPSYKLKLRNNSSKPVDGLAIDVLVGDRKQLLSQPQGKEGAALIEAGEVLETNVQGVRIALPVRNRYVPDSPPTQTVLIGAVVFKDGSYEGDANVVAQIRARTLGRKIRLTRVVKLFENALAEEASLATIAQLRQKIASLKDRLEPAAADELLAALQTYGQISRGRMETVIEGAQHYIKKDLVEEINAFERTHKSSPGGNEVREWLSSTTERYKQWLSRLQ